MEHRGPDGKLICRFVSTAPRWYDAWRIKWCTTNRKAWSVWGFREGKINPLTLGFALTVRLREVLNGTRG
jgi:hypothetical protein